MAKDAQEKNIMILEIHFKFFFNLAVDWMPTSGERGIMEPSNDMHNDISIHRGLHQCMVIWIVVQPGDSTNRVTSICAVIPGIFVWELMNLTWFWHHVTREPDDSCKPDREGLCYLHHQPIEAQESSHYQSQTLGSTQTSPSSFLDLHISQAHIIYQPLQIPWIQYQQFTYTLYKLKTNQMASKVLTSLEYLLNQSLLQCL